MKLYHRTSALHAAEILVNGWAWEDWADGLDDYRAHPHYGRLQPMPLVLLCDQDDNERREGDVLLVVTLDAPLDERWESKTIKPYRYWLVPREWLNKHATAELGTG